MTKARCPIQFYVTPAEREALDTAAYANGRSLAAHCRVLCALPPMCVRPVASNQIASIARCIVKISSNIDAHRNHVGWICAVLLDDDYTTWVNGKWLRARWYEGSEDPRPSAAAITRHLLDLCTPVMKRYRSPVGRPTEYYQVNNAVMSELLANVA